ncbi:MAG: TatD family hydrolase [Rhodospirillaceae bacterium]|nr:TatD family hydrolase [Rhodospirillaceae bacterium]
MLVDSHCHLDFPDFQDDLEGVVARAREAGVGHFLTICTHITRFEQVRAIATRFDDMHCTVGIHPHEAKNEPEIDKAKLIDIATNDAKVVAFGETGLDFFYDNSPRDIQERQFRTHIHASREAELPIVIHTRDADEEMSRIIEEEMAAGPFTGVIHCFSSSPELAEKAVDLGLYISLSGIVTFKKAEELRETAKRVPLDRVLVETDSPYLAPVPKRGKRNEPAFVAHTAACVAELHGLSPDDLAAKTTENFFRLFSKAAA